jgi:methylthioribose-1-phosphate isomerase
LPEDPVDLARRGFFRQFGREAVRTAAQVAGAADAIRSGTTAAGAELLGLGLRKPEESAVRLEHPELVRAGRLGAMRDLPGAEASRAFRSPYRLVDGGLVMVDQRRLPSDVVEETLSSGVEVAARIRDRWLDGPALVAQAAAYGLALTARSVAGQTANRRVPAIRGAANALRAARPSAAALDRAIDRMEGRWVSVGLRADGDVVADALRAEADAIATGFNLDHARLGRLLAEALPQPQGRELRLLLHGPVSAASNGMVGTGMAAVQALVAAGRTLHVWVTEGGATRPGARLTAEELRQADVPHTVVADAAVALLLAEDRVDDVLISPERIGLDGRVHAAVGSYQLAVLAAAHQVPFYVCAALASVGDGPVTDHYGREELRFAGAAASGLVRFADALDTTPAALVTALATDEGLVVPTDTAALSRALDSSESRRPALPPPAGSESSSVAKVGATVP